MELTEVPVEGSDLIDLFKVHRLLVGMIETDQQKPRTVYTEPDSEEGIAALAALAMFLRREQPLPTPIRIMLANLFDPDAPPTVSNKLVLQKRGSGRPTDVFQRRIIAQNIFDLHVGQGEKAPIEDVLRKLSKTFCMDFKTIEKLWYAERDQIAAMKGHPRLFSKRK